jgi:NAD(P)-dependent dehydrogenase (short-subunit alcohol dehydrogenase family)
MTGKDRLAGQTVVIGGSSGIGLATARAARDAGAEVVITGRSPLQVAALPPQRQAGDRRQVAAVDALDRPEDLADAVLFLMGNGYVTGINLVVDGGRLLSLISGRARLGDSRRGSPAVISVDGVSCIG